jgi:(p)ppGpp synthase/HD superfamily hydrolase
MHAGQQRGDGSPFILHPLEVGSLLYRAGADDHLVAAGVLHDLLEKTEATESDLVDRFGSRVSGLVAAVSDDDAIEGYAERKAALRLQVAGAGEHALTLFAADKLSKVRELRREAARDPAGRTLGQTRQLRARRVKHYRRSLALLEERLPGSPLVQQLSSEFNALVRGPTTLAHTT